MRIFQGRKEKKKSGNDVEHWCFRRRLISLRASWTGTYFLSIFCSFRYAFLLDSSDPRELAGHFCCVVNMALMRSLRDGVKWWLVAFYVVTISRCFPPKLSYVCAMAGFERW